MAVSTHHQSQCIIMINIISASAALEHQQHQHISISSIIASAVSGYQYQQHQQHQRISSIREYTASAAWQYQHTSSLSTLRHHHHDPN